MLTACVQPIINLHLSTTQHLLQHLSTMQHLQHKPILTLLLDRAMLHLPLLHMLLLLMPQLLT